MCSPTPQPKPFQSRQEAEQFLLEDAKPHGSLFTAAARNNPVYLQRKKLAEDYVRPNGVADKMFIPSSPAKAPEPTATHFDLASEPTNPFVRPPASPLRIPLINTEANQ